MRWAGHVESTGKMRNAYKILAGKSKEKFKTFFQTNQIRTAYNEV
jgi:hypothetical protein